MRLHRPAVAVLLIFVLSCSGGGDSSPTEPPPDPGPVALQGSWSGNVMVTSPDNAATTCTVQMTLELNQQVYLGNWNAQCTNGTQGQGIATAVLGPFNLAILNGLLSPTVFGGCGWGSGASREGNRIRGDWSTADNCPTGPVLRGRIDLTKR